MNMLCPQYALLYVADPVASGQLYSRWLGAPVVESAPTFSLLVLSNGLKLGLWLKSEVDPKAPLAGSMELAVSLGSKEEVVAIHRSAADFGLRVLEDPADLDFGFATLLADPDGHRWRIYHPAG
jgi:hypothetical protein